jgi:thioredoxin 1
MKALKFEASWCQPCKMLTKVMEDASEQITIQVDKIDIDENMELAKQYGIRGVPTLVLVDDEGKEIKRQSGVMMEAQLLEFLKG